MSNKIKVLKGARLIDGTGKDPINNSVLVIKGEVIESVGQAGTVTYPRDAEIIDASGKTAMPGLIDAHLHLFGLKSMSQLTWVMDDPLVHAIRGVTDVWKIIDAGFTTVRDLGSVYALHLKTVVNEGGCIGPRIVAAGRCITQTGGHADIIHSLPIEFVTPRCGSARIADGVAEVRKAAREQLRDGADFLKIMTTGGVMSERDASTSCQYSLEEIRAFVEEAANVGVRTSSHAQGTRGIKNALVGGVKVIEHGFWLDDECIDLMVKNNHYLVPTLAIVDTIVVNGAKIGVLPHSIQKAKFAQEAHLASFKKAYKAGVFCGLGTDYLTDPMSPMGENAVELEMYVKRAGLTPMQTIVCATKNNAEVLDMSDKIGTLEAGKLADVIVVDGDPLVDIAVLRNRKNILKIYKGGNEVPRLEATNLRGVMRA
jgi:imidazolonepropionase-like amidohydrolase